jgi:hypothetical protein
MAVIVSLWGQIRWTNLRGRVMYIWRRVPDHPAERVSIRCAPGAAEHLRSLAPDRPGTQREPDLVPPTSNVPERSRPSRP